MLSDLNGHTARTTVHAPQTRIAARSGLIPTIFITRVRWWLGCWTRGRTNWSGGDWWHSLQRLRLWPRLRLLWRTGLRLLWWLCPRVLRRLRPRVLRRLRPRILRRLPVGLLWWSRVSARCSPRIRLRPWVLSRAWLWLVIAASGGPEVRKR